MSTTSVINSFYSPEMMALPTLMVETKWMVILKADSLANEKLKDSWKVAMRAGLMADYWVVQMAFPRAGYWVVLKAHLKAGQKAFRMVGYWAVPRAEKRAG